MKEGRMASTGKKKPDTKQLQGQKSIASFFKSAPNQDRVVSSKSAPLQVKDERPIKRPRSSPAKGGQQDEAKGAASATPAQKTPSEPAGQPSSAKKQKGRDSAGKGGEKPVKTPQAPAKRASPAPKSKAAHTKVQEEPRAQNATNEPVGKRVKIFWPDEEQWFTGRVTDANARGQHHVSYDDGDKEWVSLAEEQWEVLGDQSEPKQERRTRTLVRKGSAVLLSSSESEEEASEEESDFEAGSSESEEEDEDDEDGVKTSDDDETPAPKRQKQAAKPTPALQTRPKSHQKNKGATSTPKQGTQGGVGGSKTALTAALTPKTPALNKASGAETQQLSTLTTADSERYSARAAERFPFLQPDSIKDAAGKRPGEAGYNPRSLYIPPNWFKAAKVSEGQRQWWEFKAKHFDSVLLFKMGKFYEMFEMDAHTGAEVLGLTYMKGEQPHCGFPEANYHQHAERLARAGLRVVVVEQTETPDQLRVRNEERRAAGKPKVGVVNREMVAVLTKGTLTDPDMLRSHADASYVFSLTEAPAKSRNEPPTLGACAVDCATGQLLVGSWQDDEMRTTLRAHLAALRPVEAVIPSEGLSSLTRKVLLASLRNPRLNSLQPGSEFLSAEETVKRLHGGEYFKGGSGKESWPRVLQEMVEEGSASAPAVSAFGGALSFLHSVLLDQAVVGLGKVERLTQFQQSTASATAEVDGPEFVALDGSALENLEVLETAGGSTEGTLLSILDACCTPAGRRKLKDWLCRPLGRLHDIAARQDAVHALMTDAQHAASSARKAFAGVGDLERAVARLCASSLGGFGRDKSTVVLYEDAAKRRLAAFLAALKGLQKLQGAMRGFEELGLDCALLRDLTTPGLRLPDFSAPLKELLEAADWNAAAEQGRIVPNKGVDAAFDAAMSKVCAVDEQLAEHLQEVKGLLRSKRDVTYVSHLKDSHVLEVSEELAESVPSNFELVSQKKGAKRFMNPQLRELLRLRADALQLREDAMSGILQGLVNKFAERQAVWNGAVAAMAELDALMSLAAAAEQASAYGPVCRPSFVAAGPQDAQVFRALELRHPTAMCSGGDFVPNDVELGSPNFTVITGPNMGGKSTLIRQVCLAALLAHAGALVPAKSLVMTPVDAIFVRMGARDSIISGQSTFFVELTETAAALNRAGSRSLVALDELGRGTSTADGAAIASAVLTHLAGTTRCRGLFATHYHKLADAHAGDPHVAIRHMACQVTAPAEGGPEQVTFLYKLAEGACPKSHGTNVARLAGMPSEVVEKAAGFAARLEARSSGGGRAPPHGPAQLTPDQRRKLQRISQLLKVEAAPEELVAQLRAALT